MKCDGSRWLTGGGWKWRGNWRMEWVASTLHTTSELGVYSITTANAHTSAASSRLNWRPHRFKWTRPFRRKTIYGFCACAITFKTQCAADVNGASSLTRGAMSCKSSFQCISNHPSNDAVENQDSVVLSSSLLTASHWTLQQGCTHPGRLVTAVHKSCTVEPKFVGPQVWNSLHVTLVEFLGWLLIFFLKI